jgi:hypothetical protein
MKQKSIRFMENCIGHKVLVVGSSTKSAQKMLGPVNI